MHDTASNNEMNIYKHKLKKLKYLPNGEEKNNLEEDISKNLDDYFTNCCDELMQLPSNILQNIFNHRSQIIYSQKKSRNRKITIIIITFLVSLLLFGLFYFLNCQLEKGNLIRSLDFLFNLKHKNKKEVFFDNVLLGTYYFSEGASKVKICVYQNQTKNEIIEWDGQVRYSKPNVVKTWVEFKGSKISYETKVESHIDLGPGFLRYKYFTEYKRDVITNIDGHISYGRWFENRKWKELCHL